MMQVPSSNYPSGKQRRKSTIMTRWLDDIIDKACYCATPNCNPGAEVEDSSIGYDSDDDINSDGFVNFPHARSDQHHIHQLLTSSRPKSSRVSSSTTPEQWEVAEETTPYWWVDRQDCDEIIRRPQQQRQQQQQHDNYDEKTTRRHPTSPFRRFGCGVLRSPGSDATATTVLTGSTSSSRATEVRHNHSLYQNHPPTSPTSNSNSYLSTPSRSRLQPPRGTTPTSQTLNHVNLHSKSSVSELSTAYSVHERGHSTGTMRRPEDFVVAAQPEDVDDMMRLKRAHSIRSSSTANHNTTNLRSGNASTRKVLSPKTVDYNNQSNYKCNYKSHNKMDQALRRTHSDTYYKIQLPTIDG